MTTVPDLVFVEDATIDNDVCNLDATLLPRGAEVGAIAITAPRLDTERHDALLEQAVSTLHRSSSAAQVWLLAADAIWQTDSRVARHGGFWGRLRRTGAVVDGLSELMEADQTREGEFKAFGAARVVDDSLGAVASVIGLTRNAYLMSVSGNALQPQEALRCGWQSGPWFDYDLLAYVLGQGELLCRPVGGFDDPEIGFVCAGNPHRLRQIVDR